MKAAKDAEHSFAQRLTYPSAGSKSYFSPYKVKDHAWSHSDFDKSNEEWWYNETDTLVNGMEYLEPVNYPANPAYPVGALRPPKPEPKEPESLV